MAKCRPRGTHRVPLAHMVDREASGRTSLDSTGQSIREERRQRLPGKVEDLVFMMPVKPLLRRTFGPTRPVRDATHDEVDHCPSRMGNRVNASWWASA